MKAIQKIKNQFKKLFGGATSRVVESNRDGIASKALLGHGVASARRHGRGAPSTSVVTSGESSKCLAGDSQNISSANSNHVLRHGLFLSLYSIFKKASSKLPWRSRTNHNSGFSSSSSNYSLSGTRNYIKNFRRIRILGSASLFSLGLLLLATFVPLYNVTRTEDTEAAAGTAKDSSITFTSTRSIASVDLTVTSENGTFASSTDGTNGTTDTRAAFSISTTNFTGYTLTIASNNNTSALTNANGGSLSSISSSIDESTFNTSTYNNQWGYKPSYYGSSANTNYLPSPTTTASTLDETSSANSTAKNYTIALGARADYTNASGTYSSSNYKLMYVANPVAYSITYADNSGDSTVANIPAVQSSDSVTTTTINLTTSIPTRTGYSFKSWCLGTVSSSGTSCTGTEYNSGASFGIDRTANKAINTATLTAVWTANKYTCTKQYRLQNADGSWGNYTTDTTEQVAYNSTCSYSKTVTNYKGSENGTNGSAATNSATMNSTSGITVQVSLYRNTFTCSKRYRLQNADGNYPSSYTSVTGETIRYGATCSYSQSYTNYQTQSTSATITAATTLSLDLPRNTYTLTVSASTNTSSPTGSGTYRWGQTVTVGVTKASNTTCISYATPAWSRTSGSGTLNATSGTSVTFTMTTSAATVTAASSASNVAQTITLSRSTGASGIKIGSTNYTGSSVSLNCGTYNISGNYSTNYEFSSWSRANGVAVANTSSASTTMTVSGAGTLTLNAKQSCLSSVSGTMQAFDPSKLCSTAGTSGTLTDSRGGTTKSYTVAKLADGKWWMTSNLDLPGGTKLTSSDSNVTSDYDLPSSSSSPNFSSDYAATVYNSGSTNCSASKGCYSYYSFLAATAGTGSSVSTDGYNASGSICPKGWRLPTATTSNANAQSNNNWKTGDFYALAKAYGANLESSYNQYSGTFYTNAGPGTTPNFLLSGYFDGASFGYAGSSGSYWSSTANSSTNAYELYLRSSSVNSAGSPNRKYGFPVRCVYAG